MTDVDLNQPVPSKTRAVLESALIFGLAFTAFQGMRTLHASGGLPRLPFTGRPVLAYGLLLLFGLVWVWLSPHPAVAYGLTGENPRRQIRVITAGFFPVLLLGALLSQVNWLDPPGAVLVAVAALGALALTAWLLRAQVDTQAGAGWTAGLGLVLILANPLPWSQVCGQTAYFYLLVGPAEELIFRGLIQTRLNEAFGRPFRFFGTRWGAGLLLAAAFFGLWHVAQRPLEAAGWYHGLWTFCAGLLFGYLREHSTSLAPPAFLHSLLNYFPLADLLGG